MTPQERKEWLDAAAFNIRTGGGPTDLKGAKYMAETRKRIGGTLPWGYPRIGGGCYVASVENNEIRIDEITDET